MQYINDIKELYENQQYNEIINIYNINKERKISELFLYAGFVFTKLGLAEEAIECLSKVDKSQFNSFKGKIYRYIGLSNYLLGNYDLAQSSFSVGEESFDEESRLWNKLLFPSLYDIRETDSIVFRFVNNFSPFDKKIFILKNIKALKRINDFIGKNKSRKKIDIYVYKKRIDSIGNSLSYSINGLKVIHTYVYDVSGHEIAHILFNGIYQNIAHNQFIDEGIATFFDQDQTYDKFIKDHKNNMAKLDVIELWTNPNLRLENIKEYYFAGAFVAFLLKTYGKEKFLEFLQNQSYENAKKVFGLSFDSTIQYFYNDLL